MLSQLPLTLIMNSSMAVEKMGDLLLQGWVMTDQSCPVCRAPLMRSPVDESLLCVNCQQQETKSLENEVPELEQSNGMNQDSIHADDRLGPYAVITHDHTPNVSDLLAQKMIQGFTLLSSNCPICHTPLVSKQPTIEPFCVSCESVRNHEPHQNKRTFEERQIPSPSLQKLPRPIIQRHEDLTDNEAKIESDWIQHSERILISRIVKVTQELDNCVDVESEQTTVNLLNSYLDSIVKLKRVKQLET